MVAHWFNELLFEAEDCDLWRSVWGHSEHPHLQAVCLVNNHIKYQSLQLVSTDNAPNHSFNTHENRANLTYPLYIPIIPYSLFPAIFTNIFISLPKHLFFPNMICEIVHPFELRVWWFMPVHRYLCTADLSKKQPISALTSLAWLLPTIIIRDDMQIQYPNAVNRINMCW